MKKPGIAAGLLLSPPCAARSALLDRREQPVAALRPREVPHFGRFLRRFVAFGSFAGGAIDIAVFERIAHRDARIFLVAFTPCLGKIALQELHVADLVDDAAARVLRQFLGVVGQHLGREMRAQAGEILAAIGSLDLAEQTLERVEVLRLDFKLLNDWCGSGAAAKSAEAAQRGALQRLLRISCRTRHAGIGRLRLRAALPPAIGEERDTRDQRDLRDEAEDRREAREAAQEAAAEQHAEQSGAQEAKRKPAKQAAPG